MDTPGMSVCYTVVYGPVYDPAEPFSVLPLSLPPRDTPTVDNTPCLPHNRDHRPTTPNDARISSSRPQR